MRVISNTEKMQIRGEYISWKIYHVHKYIYMYIIFVFAICNNKKNCVSALRPCKVFWRNRFETEIYKFCRKITIIIWHMHLQASCFYNSIQLFCNFKYFFRFAVIFFLHSFIINKASDSMLVFSKQNYYGLFISYICIIMALKMW